MLAGCTALLSPRHRLRGTTAASATASCQFQGQQRSAPGLHSQQIQSCHFPLQEKFFPSQQVASPTSQHNISSQKGVTELPCSSYSRNEERAASSREGQRSQVSDVVMQREKLSMEETAPYSQRRHAYKGSSGKMAQAACWMERPQARVMERQKEITGTLMAKNAETLWESSKRRENLKRFSEHNTADDCCEDRAKRLRGSPSEDLNGKFCVSQLGTHWFGENCDKIDSVSETRGSSGLPATLFNSPEQKSNNTYEPRSVLDLVISPGLKPRSFSPVSSQPLQQLLTVTADYSQGFTIADLQDIEKSNSGLTHLHQPEALPRTSIPSPFPFSSNAWVESIISDFAGKGQADATNGDPNKTNSSSCSVPPNTLKNDDGNSSGNDSGHEGAPHNEFPNIMQILSGGGAIGTEQTHMEQGLELVNLLIACAEAVSSKSLHLVSHFISRLGELASPESSPMHRVAAYFTEGLILRSTKLWPHVFHPIAVDLDLSDDDLMTGFQLINHISPIPKFFHYTSNEIILKAFEDKDRVHIIDFDIKQGLQWPALFQSLASRPKPPTHVRITGIGESKEDLQDTGDRLAGFAEALNLPFEFHAVVDKLEDVRLWMLHVKDNETVAVNCLLQLHKTLYGNGSALRDLLGLIQSTKPAVVAMVEQEASHNDATFEGRFLNSLQYYSAIFDSIDANLPPDSPARFKVEQFYAREIRNIIACEGPERIERHEKFVVWKHMMEEGGFTQVPLRDREVFQARMLLEMFSCKSYRLKQQDGGLTLSWLEQPLFTASAWEPRGIDGASTSSPT
ncbi:hypothetical protein SUGI_0519480 [Cryptomeria japonica]|uniref:scarecrow-like protein 28 n=1 Tax=Cryptomeria japonica TaxID=3369 RepID=UPI002408D822|nr:scarecrow-like protein 28 [Cryptomeria japonica]GLJ26688.1 hypothetical protein SUGI_0519480 [Cryptomeria japonica]